MRWIDHSYDLVWDKIPPSVRELKNSKPSRDHSEFVNEAVDDIIKAGACSVLTPGVLPTVVSPLGVVTKAHSTKLRLIVDMRYVNDHLAKRIFKFEGLSDLPDMSEKGNYSLSLTTSHRGIIMWLCTLIRVTLLVFVGKAYITSIIVSHSGCRQPHGCSQKSSMS
jgi:hypothetical protein